MDQADLSDTNSSFTPPQVFPDSTPLTFRLSSWLGFPVHSSQKNVPANLPPEVTALTRWTFIHLPRSPLHFHHQGPTDTPSDLSISLQYLTVSSFQAQTLSFKYNTILHRPWAEPST